MENRDTKNVESLPALENHCGKITLLYDKLSLETEAGESRVVTDTLLNTKVCERIEKSGRLLLHNNLMDF
jgi:hypothetical protein